MRRENLAPFALIFPPMELIVLDKFFRCLSLLLDVSKTSVTDCRGVRNPEKFSLSESSPSSLALPVPLSRSDAFSSSFHTLPSPENEGSSRLSTEALMSTGLVSLLSTLLRIFETFFCKELARERVPLLGTGFRFGGKGN